MIEIRLKKRVEIPALKVISLKIQAVKISLLLEMSMFINVEEIILIRIF